MGNENTFTYYYDNWSFYLLLGITIFVAYLFANYKKEIQEYFKLVRQLKLSEQNFRNRDSESTLVNLGLNLSYYLVLGILIARYLSNKGLNQWGIIEVLQLGAVIMFLYIGRSLANFILVQVVDFKQSLSFYNYHISLQNKVMGLLLLPIAWMITFGALSLQPILIYVVIILYVILFIFRLFNFFRIGKAYFRVYKFYFFLYFCSSELLPNLVLLKWALTD